MSIKEKFQKKIYKLETIPRIIDIKGSKLTINKYAPYPDEIESLEGKNFDNNLNLIDTYKLKTPWRDSEFSIGIIKIEHFDSREYFDHLFYESNVERKIKYYNKISINKAFELLDVEISCDMDYYLENQNEIEKDLNRKVEKKELGENNLRIKLEQELFYVQMLNLFGNDEVDDSFDNVNQDTLVTNDYFYEKVLNLKDFYIHTKMNEHLATAQRGKYYLTFDYAF
jgi:hypothetical protein